MKIKVVDVINLYGYLKQVEQALFNFKFSYAIVKNIDRLETEMKLIQKKEEMLKGYKEKTRPLYEKHGTKAANGNIAVPQANIEAFRAEVAVIDASDEFKQVLADWKAFTEEECDFEPFQFDLDVLPKEITGAEIRLMKPLIKE